jgi:peptidyl-dipeptidase A
MNRRIEQFVKSTVEAVRPLEKAYYLAEWEAAVKGSEQALAGLRKAQGRFLRFWSDPRLYETAGELDRGTPPSDPLLARQVRLIYLQAARHRQDEATIERITELEARVRKRYYNHRGRVDGRELSDNEIDRKLRHSRESEQVRKVWEASKQVGGLVAGEVRELARLRNAAARVQGFRDHFQRALVLEEIDEEKLFALLADLAETSREPFARLKAELDRALCARFGTAQERLRPWHYGDRFFQDGPETDAEDMDRLFADRDLEKLARRSYEGLGLEVERILSRSDLYPRPGKNQHAFCIHLDREGDIRTLNNLQASHRWAETLLHELGHGVYDQYLDPELPWLLRAPAHTLTTEAVALLMGSLTYDRQWLEQVLEIPKERAASVAAAARDRERAKKLIFTRWCMVVTFFERELYRDPEADLDGLWWDLVEKYQLLRRPEGRRAPDWAAKIHIALFPVYYHNYQLGHLLAAQLRARIVGRFGGIVGRPQAGSWLIERVFRPGAGPEWSALIEQATGEALQPRYFVESVAC